MSSLLILFASVYSCEILPTAFCQTFLRILLSRVVSLRSLCDCDWCVLLQETISFNSLPHPPLFACSCQFCLQQFSRLEFWRHLSVIARKYNPLPCMFVTLVRNVKMTILFGMVDNYVMWLCETILSLKNLAAIVPRRINRKSGSKANPDRE